MQNPVQKETGCARGRSLWGDPPPAGGEEPIHLSQHASVPIHVRGQKCREAKDGIWRVPVWLVRDTRGVPLSRDLVHGGRGHGVCFREARSRDTKSVGKFLTVQFPGTQGKDGSHKSAT